MCDVAAKASETELLEWYEEHCLWSRRVDPYEHDKLSRTGIWEVYVATGAGKSVTFGGKTFLDAVRSAKGICEA